MKALSAGLIAIAVFVVSVGFFRVWFALSTSASQAGNDEVNINLTVNTEKMKQDVKVVTDEATALTNGATNEVKADGRVNDNLKSLNP
jgi:hypothetical protein